MPKKRSSRPKVRCTRAPSDIVEALRAQDPVSYKWIGRRGTKALNTVRRKVADILKAYHGEETNVEAMERESHEGVAAATARMMMDPWKPT